MYGTGIYFPLCAFPFSLIILLLFYFKGYIKNLETKIYKVILILNFIGLILEMLCTYASYIYNVHPIISEIIYKLYLLYLIAWISSLLYYFYCVLNKEIEHKKNRYKFIGIYYLINIIILAISPIEVVIENNFQTRYTTGLAVHYVYLICSIVYFLMILLILMNLKSLKNKKYVPIFVFLVLFLISTSIQLIHPELLLITYVETLVTAVMYFTIENPDAKLVEYEKTEKERAEAASLAKSEFLSSMSHELRTPLNAIVGLSEDIDSYKDKVPEEVREDTKDIINASNTLLEIIGSILDISKIESGKLDIICGDYDPREEFESVAKINRTKFAEKNLTFNVQIADNIPEVLFGDRLRIKQIINNFLSNAYKYSDSGQVDYIVNWLDASQSLQIIVKDQGRGIKPEDIGKLFGKYDRLGVEKESNVQGTGLGLNITKTLIDMMGGKVEVQSQYLVGSTFTVTLPQKIGSKEELERIRKENARVVDKLDYRGKRLLVVDDNMLNIKVLKKAIKAFNFIVDECYNGKEALEKIEMNNNYDIVLMDILMPIMGGEEAIQCLRSMPNFHSPVVALTADAMTGAKEKYKGMGFDDYMAKPFTRDTIAKKLSGILGDGKEEKEVKKKDNLENTATINVTINNYNVDCDNKK